MPKKSITQAELKELLDYNPETGIFTWKVARNQNAREGAPAGTVMNTGYVMVHINGLFITGHRLAWLYLYGELPSCHIDHIDQDKTNNAARNLRLAPNNHADNSQNRGLQANNTTGYPGVHFCRRDKKFIVRVSVKGQRIVVGYYDTLEDAIAARDAAKAEYYTFEPIQRGVRR